MFSFIKRPLYALSNKIRGKRSPVGFMKERWIANFSKPERSYFIIKPEISRNAKVENGSLFLGLKKENCMAWLETANRVYVDQIIEARFRFDCPGGYCAAGIMFRVMESGTYYLALVSNKGYFRLDAVNDKVPRPLVGWTEAPTENGEHANPEHTALGITAKGDHLIFTLNGKWVAEVNDASIPGGHLGFALVSYGSESIEDSPTAMDGYVCQAWLDYLSVDSRPKAVGKEYGRWIEGAEINAESRLCLAETFAALGHFAAAHDQILKAWKQREDAARSVTATYTDMRSGKELLFAAQMASHLGLYETAERYINLCLSVETNDMSGNADEVEVLAEKAKVLSALNKFDELAAFLPDYIRKLETESPDSPPVHPLYALLGHAWWNLENHEAAAVAWGKAFDLDKNNGLYAENAANAFEVLGRKEEALRYLLARGGCFLRQANFEGLGALVPRLLAIGQDSQEAHKLVGEWAKGVGDLDSAEAEFALAAGQVSLVGEVAAKKVVRGRKAVASKGGEEVVGSDLSAETLSAGQASALSGDGAKKTTKGEKTIVHKGRRNQSEETKTKTKIKPASKARAKIAGVAKPPEKVDAKAKPVRKKKDLEVSIQKELAKPRAQKTASKPKVKEKQSGSKKEPTAKQKNKTSSSATKGKTAAKPATKASMA